jgi:hypothetical protein
MPTRDTRRHRRAFHAVARGKPAVVYVHVKSGGKGRRIRLQEEFFNDPALQNFSGISG